MKLLIGVATVILLLLLPAKPANAWLLFEHDRIGGEGFRRMSDADRATLQLAWQTAIAGRGKAANRYCRRVDQLLSTESVSVRGEQTQWCVGFATLTALAGDHACVPSEMISSIEDGDWMGPLLVESWAREQVVAALRVTDVVKRTNAWRDHNMAVQGIDPGLVPRAQNNRSHFPAPLDVTSFETDTDDAEGEGGGGTKDSKGKTKHAPIAQDMADYFRRALARGALVSSVTMYLHYHVIALREASAWGRGCTSSTSSTSSSGECGKPTPTQLWKALVAESFAIHFLQDSFSAGHIVGTWGDLGQRLGSHDYYSTNGLDVRTWGGRVYTAYGDAFLTQGSEDERIAGAAVATSLAQLARVLRASEAGIAPGADIAGGIYNKDFTGDDTYTGCDRSLTTPRGLDAIAREPFAVEVLQQFPIPTSRGHGMPRFRSEVGGFLGIMLEGNGTAVLGATDQLPSTDARLRVGLGAGFALEGAFSRFMDGRFLIDALVAVSLHEYEVGRRAIGFGGRLRMPFVLLPGDAIYLVAPAALINPRWGYELGRSAAAGGAAGIERQVILRENISFQFMLGREAVAVWFPDVGWQIDIPTFELRGDRLFTGAFATESVFQIGPTISLLRGEAAVGVSMSFAERIRRYMPQSAREDER